MTRNLRLFLAAVMLLASTSAAATYTASASTSTIAYKAGSPNVFHFLVSVQYNGTFEYVDQIKITFPAGWSVSSATGPTGTGGCATNTGVQTIAGNVVSWSAAAPMPTGCGAFYNGSFPISITVTPPAATTGTQIVLVTTTGDGYPSSTPSIQNFPLSFLTNLLDVDGNGTVDALTDGLLILRYMFGLRGAALIQGAVGPGATRVTATDIENYLNLLIP